MATANLLSVNEHAHTNACTAACTRPPLILAPSGLFKSWPPKYYGWFLSACISVTLILHLLDSGIDPASVLSASGGLPLPAYVCCLPVLLTLT